MTAPSSISEALHLSVLGMADSRAVARTTVLKGGESHMFLNLYSNLQTRLSREEGQTMAEYGVVLAVITVFVIAAFQLLGTNIDSAIRDVAGKIAP